MNGVLFTGGGLNLLDNNGRHHPYYETAKQIFNYSLFKKDVLGETWPVLGICQGLEVVSLILSGDVDTLDEVRIHGESRPIKWAVDEETSHLFGGFTPQLAAAMEAESLALHAHSFSIGVDTYESVPGLNRFMRVLQTDAIEQDGKHIEFIAAMEAKDYPIYCTMYHPEY